MKAIDYLNQLINWGNVFVPFTLAAPILHAATALGYPTSAGAYDADTEQITLYLNR